MEELKVRVNGGTLIAVKNSDPNYPGISVFYRTENGDLIDIVLTEVKKEGDNKDIDVYTYENVASDEYTRKYTLQHKEIEEVIKEFL